VLLFGLEVLVETPVFFKFKSFFSYKPQVTMGLKHFEHPIVIREFLKSRIQPHSREPPWSSGELCGLTIRAMALGRGFKSYLSYFKFLRIRLTKGFKGPFVIYAPILVFECVQCYTRHFVLYIMDPIQIIANINVLMCVVYVIIFSLISQANFIFSTKMFLVFLCFPDLEYCKYCEYLNLRHFWKFLGNCRKVHWRPDEGQGVEPPFRACEILAPVTDKRQTENKSITKPQICVYSKFSHTNSSMKNCKL